MHLPSARPEERSVYEFSISPLYSAAQVLLGVAIPFLFLAAARGLIQAGIISQAGAATASQVALVAGGLIGLIPIGSALYLRLARHYFITTERIIAVIGWLAQEQVSIDFPAITDLTVSRDVFERFVTASGNLSIDTAGSPADEITLIHIANPVGVRDQILELVEKAKQLVARLTRNSGGPRKIVVAPSSAATPIPTNPDVVDANDDGVLDAEAPPSSEPGTEHPAGGGKPASSEETP